MSVALAPPAATTRLRLGLRGALVGAVVVLAALPLLNLLPQAHPLHVSDFTVSVTGKWICYAILAL